MAFFHPNLHFGEQQTQNSTFTAQVTPITSVVKHNQGYKEKSLLLMEILCTGEPWGQAWKAVWAVGMSEQSWGHAPWITQVPEEMLFHCIALASRCETMKPVCSKECCRWPLAFNINFSNWMWLHASPSSVATPASARTLRCEGWGRSFGRL